MKLPAVPSQAVVDHLNDSYFSQIWNAPSDHDRLNERLPKASMRVATGAIPINQSMVGLPTIDTVYAVYKVGGSLFGRFINFTPDTWVTDSSFVKAFGVSILVYTADGRTLPPGTVFLRYVSKYNCVLIAISQVYTTQCTGTMYPDLYMTLYRDTSRNTPIISQAFQVTSILSGSTTPTLVTTAIQNALRQYPAGTTITINGWAYDSSVIPTLKVGDVVSIVSDPDIVGYCDLSIDDNQTGYYSNLYSEYREILHIPKLLNSNNVVITNDSLSMVVFDIATKRGVYGHRIDEHALESITHNDFSVGRTALQAFQNALGSQGVFVRLYVRFSNAKHVLSDDGNYIRDLYSLSDDEIKRQLVSLSLNQISEWKASHLEQSDYLNLLYATRKVSADNLMATYVNAMGYYDVAAKLSQSLMSYVYKGAAVEITKPKRLYGITCEVLVYANGRKIPSDAVGITNLRTEAFQLGFKAGSYVHIGTLITVYIAEAGLRTPILFSPTSPSPSITLDNDDYAVVQSIAYTNPQAVWQGSVTQGYHSYPVSPGDYTLVYNADGTVTYKISPTHFGTDLYLISNCGMTTTTYSLDTLLANKQALIFPLTVQSSTGVTLPLIQYGALEVYINGYRLIEGLDYSCNPVVGSHDDTLQTLLEISNQEYINFGFNGNYLEVVVHGDSVISGDTGYVIENTLHRTDAPMVWNPSCSRAFVKGVLVNQIQEVGNVVTSTQPLVDGSPYLLEWNLSYGAAKLLKGQSITEDQNLRVRIDRVLGIVPVVYPDTVDIYDLYALYSPYLATIANDVASGAFTIVDERKDDQFLKQFLPYTLLQSRDPVFGNNPKIDRRFVTLAAHYANFAVSDATQMILLHRLISLVLTPANLALEEVLV